MSALKNASGEDILLTTNQGLEPHRKQPILEPKPFEYWEFGNLILPKNHQGSSLCLLHRIQMSTNH